MKVRSHFRHVAVAAITTAWLLCCSQTMTNSFASRHVADFGNHTVDFQDNGKKCSIKGLKTNSVENTRAKLSYELKGQQVIEFGICYSNAGKPTESSSKIIDYQDEPKDVPDYISLKTSMRGLTSDTKYFVRAYVKSSGGEVLYSDEVEFSTPKEIDYAAMLNGPKTEYYPNGQVMKKYKLKDGQIDGMYEFFSDSGRLVSTQMLKEGIPNGQLTTFYNNGKVQAVTNFKDGLLQGESISYYPDGTTKSRSVCTGDPSEPDCENQTYYPDGSLDTESRTSKGKLDFAIHYDNQGRVVLEEKPGATTSYSYDNDGWKHTSFNGEKCQCSKCQSK